MKKFLISIDTEGDNLWNWKAGDQILTENGKYLDRFQNLCNQYGFKPTYLTNYEMITDDQFRSWLKRKAHSKECEVGMHLHAWSTPPYVKLGHQSGTPAQPYLIEYETEIINLKVSAMTETLSQAVELKITTHRSGRWAMDDRYFAALAAHGYKIDCSVTPHVDWSAHAGETEGSKGSNYSDCPEYPYIVSCEIGNILEIPVTVRNTNHLFLNHVSPRAIGSAVKKALNGQKIWLRPNGHNLKQMMWLVEQIANDSESDYIMFMLHSSELMPGGSPTFQSNESIEHLYEDLNVVFKEASKKFEGCTIDEYGSNLLSKGIS
ncbi:MAG: hypothetical protein IKY18_06155 [Oscillospiraceae bacterium]|nr:hypothetical protein [Oscillospiraceae bacterium]